MLLRVTLRVAAAAERKPTIEDFRRCAMFRGVEDCGRRLSPFALSLGGSSYILWPNLSEINILLPQIIIGMSSRPGQMSRPLTGVSEGSMELKFAKAGVSRFERRGI